MCALTFLPSLLSLLRPVADVLMTTRLFRLRRDGYIAGVCNPAFADRPSWWDVLCNIETGKIVVSKDLRSPPPPSTTASTLTAGSRNTLGKAEMKEWGAAMQGVDEFGAPTTGGGGGGGAGGEKKEGKGEGSDQVFMEEVRSLSFFLLPPSLPSAAELTIWFLADPQRHLSALRRIRHPRPFHRLRRSLRPSRLTLRRRHDLLLLHHRGPQRGLQRWESGRSRRASELGSGVCCGGGGEGGEGGGDGSGED